MEQKQWANTGPAVMLNSKQFEYQCNYDGHRHKITTSEKLSESKRICKYCGKIMIELTYALGTDLDLQPQKEV